VWLEYPFICRYEKGVPLSEKGSPDCARDPRGFAIKHYTEDGIYDMVGNNTPIFFIRDPQKFPDFIHTQKKNPQTNLSDANAFWDFASLVPESVHQFSFLFSDRGTPFSYRHMNGYSSHTFKWVNVEGDGFWIKLHYKTAQGIKNFTREQAMTADIDHSTRDLFESIASGDHPVWNAFVQVMPLEAAAKYKWNVFDITKVWPHKDYPLIPYGKLVLNRNPLNYFAEVEQAAFAPGHLVPGVEPSLDRLLQGRLFSYPDTHRHRLGANYLQIPVNCPYATKIRNHQRDGPMSVNGNQGAEPNYEPNSISGTPKEVPSSQIKKFYLEGWVARFPQEHPNSDFEQAGVFYREVLAQKERDHLITNIVEHLCNARPDIQGRMIDVFSKCDKDYGQKVADGLKKKKKNCKSSPSKSATSAKSSFASDSSPASSASPSSSTSPSSSSSSSTSTAAGTF